MGFEPRVNRTLNLREIPSWNPTRYHCAMGPRKKATLKKYKNLSLWPTPQESPFHSPGCLGREIRQAGQFVSLIIRGNYSTVALGRCHGYIAQLPRGHCWRASACLICGCVARAIGAKTTHSASVDGGSCTLHRPVTHLGENMYDQAEKTRLA